MKAGFWGVLFLGLFGQASAMEQWDLFLGAEERTRLPEAIDRISVADPSIADVVLLKPTEVLLVGKALGTTTVMIWRGAQEPRQYRVQVQLDLASLRAVMQKALPDEADWQIQSLGKDIVLSGRVSDVVAVHQLEALATAYVEHRDVKSPPGKVINLLTLDTAQQVEIHVQVAEVSRSFIEQWGGRAQYSGKSMSFLSDFSAAGGAHLGVQVVSGLFGGAVNLSRQEGVVKTLAEPTLLALSGQEANFLAGGKVFIPITQASPQGSVLTSLEEKEFGIALKFTPTVLKHGVIHLKVAPEVSEINTQGLSLNLSGSATATVLPMFTSRRAATTVELKEGDSLVIGGLVQHNHQSTLQRFPWLGDLPVLGVLFRSAQFQRDDTELVFIVTPRRVLRSPTALPTDRFREPLHDEFFLEGRSGSEASVETKEVPRGDLPAEAFPYEGATLTPAYRRLLETTQTPSAPALKAPGAPGFQP